MEHIKNREASNIQITAEQLVHDARTQFAPSNVVVPQTVHIADREELNDFLQRKRKDYEERIRKHSHMLRAYLDYARFEASHDSYPRARSILERASNKLAYDPSFWIAYSEIEMKGGFQNHALNVLNRAVGLLPRVDSLWFKYALFQEAIGDEEKTRSVFERWMSWEPKADEPWFAYASFEERHNQTARARDVYERYCGTHPTCRAYIKYAKWEDSHGRPLNARWIFERSIGALPEEENKAAELPESELKKPEIWIAFAEFEAKRNEFERTRAVYEAALSQVSQEARGRIFANFAAFEKKCRTESTEHLDTALSIVILRRKNEYEEILKENPFDYDTWFDMIRLEESLGDIEKIREVYSRAQSYPPSKDSDEKRFWRRFIYFYIYEAVFEEITGKDLNRAQKAYEKALEVIPHTRFTFSKLWILYSNFLLRNGKNLTEARKLLGKSIGLCPKDKTFRHYIQLELQLGQVERCRVLYQKYLLWNPTNSQAWAKYAEMEKAVGEIKRSRALFELGISQPILDEPEKLWLRYIDFELNKDQEFEVEEEEEKADETENKTTPTERAKRLYERLIERTEGKSAKVWIAFAKFLAFSTSVFTIENAREILEKGEKTLKEANLPEARGLICSARVELERRFLLENPENSKELLQKAIDRIPKKVEKIGDDGVTITVEWLFPQDVFEEAQKLAIDEENLKKAATLKMLQEAQRWKKMKLDGNLTTTTSSLSSQ